MAALDDLIKQVEDEALRRRLLEEINRAAEKRKFGLVFEEHLPECTPIYGTEIKRGSNVARKDKVIKDIFFVLHINGNEATCINNLTGEQEEIEISELVEVAQFGEPIFPSFIPAGSVKNADTDQLWHTLIESDNFHALQVLEYLYPKQLDCIYIDPPYNTGARDWKYNNNYVDENDRWRHSKWLSMMQNRLKIAKRLLNPDTGVLIVTIDEHELHHLRTLLQQLFPEAYIQVVTIVINPKGVTQGRFSRVEEYAVYCFMPKAYVSGGDDPLLGNKPTTNKPRWKGLLRSGSDSRREDSKNQFYPVLIDSENRRVIKAGETLPYGTSPDLDMKIEGYDVAWPIRTDQSEGRWGVSNKTLNNLIEKGYVAVGKYDPKRKTWGISYLSKKPQQQIENGELQIVNRDSQRNVVDVQYLDAQERQVKTVWHRNTHDAGVYGSDLVSGIIGQSRAFTFPKSLYAVKDSLSAVVKNNKNALILDFFAGSGTTLHATNLLNAEDGGHRRCILVTNNEVSDEVAKELKVRGYKTGDREWEENGICEAVTWPRAKFSILGKRDDGTILEGEYLTNKKITTEVSRSFLQINITDIENLNTVTKKKQLIALLGKEKLPQSLVKIDSKFLLSEKHKASILFDDTSFEEWINALEDQDHISEFYIVTKNNAKFKEIKKRIEEFLGNIIIYKEFKKPMSEGFEANVEYFKLGFLEKNNVMLGQQFKEILPLLWLKSGAVGKRPEIIEETLPDMLIPENSNFAVLNDETYFAEFQHKVNSDSDILDVYLVTNSDGSFREMTSQLKNKRTIQLYSDYIDNFMINSRRI